MAINSYKAPIVKESLGDATLESWYYLSEQNFASPAHTNCLTPKINSPALSINSWVLDHYEPFVITNIACSVGAF
jgi:hypothetical protein